MKKIDETSGYIPGQCLVAMPGMGDLRFNHAVIYLCTHSAEGAMGLIINHIVEQISFSDLLGQLNVEPTEHCKNIAVHFGGPVESSRGFVLHSTDYVQDATMLINKNVGLTATVDILRDIAQNKGPKHSLLALGYAGWNSGQLEEELKKNTWLTVDAGEDVLFEKNNNLKWEKALAKIGVDPAKLSDITGTA